MSSRARRPLARSGTGADDLTGTLRSRDMAYRAIQTDGSPFRFDRRDDSAGILGSFPRLDDAQVLFSSESREEIDLRIKAHFYDHPNTTVYLIDDANRVHGVFLHQGEADARTALAEERGFGYALAFVVLGNLAIAAFVAAAAPGVSALRLIAIVAAMSLAFIALVKSGNQNGVEGAAMVTIASILVWTVAGR